MQTLDQFIQQLNDHVQTKGLNNVLDLERQFVAYNGNDWKKKLDHDDPKTTILFQDEHLKLILIYWNGFQKSKKHGHPGEGGLINVLSGTLMETRFDPKNSERIIGKHHYSSGNISYIHDDIALHAIENTSQTPAISLHLYALKAATAKVPSTNQPVLAQYDELQSAA